jgi:hypothetical protein
MPPDASLLEILFTAMSLGTGGSGGIVTPIFFIGATAGSAAAHIMGLDQGTFAAIGMVAVQAGAGECPAGRLGHGDRAVRPEHRVLRRHRRDRGLHK